MARKKKFSAVANTRLKSGDPVMVICGGNSAKGKALNGETGKLKKIMLGEGRAVVAGLNMIKRHKRATGPNDSAGIVELEGSIHLSNIMYYSAEHERPFRLCSRKLDDGRKVRGFRHPDSGEFVQID